MVVDSATLQTSFPSLPSSPSFPSFPAFPAAPPGLQYLVFRRGIGMDQTSSDFVIEKVDVILARLANFLMHDVLRSAMRWPPPGWWTRPREFVRLSFLRHHNCSRELKKHPSTEFHSQLGVLS